MDKVCHICEGTGSFEDSTYDRAGVSVRCSTCRGTGWPEKRLNRLIDEFLAPMRANPAITLVTPRAKTADHINSNMQFMMEMAAESAKEFRPMREKILIKLKKFAKGR